jgi:rhodanese-related sulfurtransferase
VNASTPKADRVDAATVKQWLDQDETVTIIDVRTPAEFETAHIRGSYNVPLHLLSEHAEEVSRRLDHHVVVHCQSGARASEARKHLAAAGMNGVSVLDGGVAEFEQAGGEVVRGRQRWALERQVRLVAGSLVTASIAASLLAPKARFLAGAVGAGLTFAAITDTCAMGRALSALPYNRGIKEPGRDQVINQLPGSHQAA